MNPEEYLTEHLMTNLNNKKRNNMAKELSVLQQQAEAIKTEVNKGANTSSRIGGMFSDMLDYNEEKRKELSNKTAGVNYVTCETAASTAAKTVSITGLTSLTTGIRLLVKMTNNNTASNATLNINSLGAKPLYYDNERASSDNSWEAGEVIDVYYDGTNFYSSNVQGGSSDGGNQILDWTTDVATTRKLIPIKKRKKGLSITYINDLNETVNEQYLKNVFTDTEWTNDSNWVRYSMYKDARIREVRSGGFRCIGYTEITSDNFGVDYPLPVNLINSGHKYAIYAESNFDTSNYTIRFSLNGLPYNYVQPQKDYNMQNGYMLEYEVPSNGITYQILISSDIAIEGSDKSIKIWIYDLESDVAKAFESINESNLDINGKKYKPISILKKDISLKDVKDGVYYSLQQDINVRNTGEGQNKIGFLSQIGHYDFTKNKKYAVRIYSTCKESYISAVSILINYSTGFKNIFSSRAINTSIRPGFIHEFSPEDIYGDFNGVRYAIGIDSQKAYQSREESYEIILCLYEVEDTFENYIQEIPIIKRISQALNINSMYNIKLAGTININDEINTSGTYIDKSFDFGLSPDKSRLKVFICKIKSNNQIPLQITEVRAVYKSGNISETKGAYSVIPNYLDGEYIFEAGIDMQRNGQNKIPNFISFKAISTYSNVIDATAYIYEISIKSSIYDGLVDVTYSPDKHLPVGLTRVDISSELITVKSDHTLSGIPAKNVDFKYTFDTGKVFTCKADIDYQGASSLGYPKKNLKIDLLDDEGEAVELRIGTWIPMDGFHLKANWVDSTHCRNIIANRVIEQIYLSRGERPWDAYNDYSESDLLKRIDTGAIGHVDGFPIEIYINNEYVGLYTFNLNKHRSNFNMKKSNTNQIQIQMGVGMTWNTLPVKWTAMEIRNPKSDSGNEEFTEAVEPAEGEVKTAIERFAEFCNGATLASPTFTKEDFKDYLNIPFWIDFILFCDFTGNWDGYINNTMMCTWDGLHWAPLVYDLDSVFGSEGGGSYDTYNVYIKVYDNNQQIIKKIIDYYNDELIKRYIELRATGIFSVGNINKLINDFMVNIGENGYEKEQELWPNTPSNGGNSSYVWYDGKQRILSFVKGKILHMDLKYGLIQSRLY